MGLQDRDYFREQYRHAASQGRRLEPTTPSASTRGIWLFWIVVLAIGFVAFHLSTRVSSPPKGVVQPARAAVAAPRTASPPTSSIESMQRSPVVPTSIPSPVATAPIYRCGNSYSQAPCAGGRQVDTSAAAGFVSRPSERMERFVAGGRTTESTTDTRALNNIPSNGSLVGMTDAGTRDLQCRGLAQEIIAVDGEARRPQTAAWQDDLRARRQRLRDQQNTLHC